jgi:hypothetical protein
LYNKLAYPSQLQNDEDDYVFEKVPLSGLFINAVDRWRVLLPAKYDD